MSDELQDAEHRANRLADQVETLCGQNTELADCVNALRIARAGMQQQRDQLLNAARPIVGIFPRVIPPHMIHTLQAAVAANTSTGPGDTGLPIADALASAEYAVSRLDAALERAHDESGYDAAIAVRDAARSLSGGLAATCMEADALVAELDALAERGGPLSDTDDPAYAGYRPANCRCVGPPYKLEPEQQEAP